MFQDILSHKRRRGTGRQMTAGRWSGLAVLAVALLVTLVASSCDKNKSNNNSTGSTPTGPLTISGSNPIPSNQSANPNASVSVTFNRAVDPTTVTETSFFVDTVSGTRLTSGSTITFTPINPFTQGETYHVTVTQAVTDMSGASLETAYNFSFRVAVTPTAVAGNDTTFTKGGTVALDGSNSVDPDGNSLTYYWTQIDGPSVGSLMGVQPSFTAPNEVTSMAFQLVVSNGTLSSSPDTITIVIAEDGAHAIFVSPNGNDGNPGTMASPKATLANAISAATTIVGDVYAAAGTYSSTVYLADGVSLYGGFNASNWIRDIALNTSTINGGSYAIMGIGVNNLTIDGFTVKSANGAGTASSSVGLSLNNSTGIVVAWNTFDIGNGTNGGAGSNQADRTGSADGGDDGTDAYFALSCDGRGGGAGGNVSYGRDGGKGGRSGGVNGGANGATAENGGGGGGAAGGFAANGKDGGPGAPGDSGKSGIGGVDFGTVNSGYYYASNGANGANGAYGYGGGGGGGGGTGAACSGSGGGGGAGGLNGLGGGAGSGGGGSFGIILSNGSDADIHDNTILLGDGGNGAQGGSGGAGQNGGGSGSGGKGNANGGAGGDGGGGGKGGHGGFGGAGGGGPVVGIVEEASNSTRSNNDITLGTPGTGGARTDGKGHNGADGDRAEYKKIS